MNAVWKNTVICLCLLWGMAGYVHAQGPIKVAAIKIPLMVESAEKGLFIDLLDEISERTGLKFDVRVYPGKRAHALYRSGEVDILLPFPRGNRIQTGLLTHSIYTKRDFVFVRKGQQIPRSLDALSGMVLGVNAHYRYKPSLYKKTDIRLEKAQSDETNIHKLVSGRIDGFLVEELSGLAAIEKNAAYSIVYDQKYPIFTYEAVILIRPSTIGFSYQNAIDNALKNIREDKTYFRIMNMDNDL